MSRAPARDVLPAESFRWVWRLAICESDLSATARHTAHVLATHMNADGGSCYPSLDRLVSETRHSRATVVKAIRELEARGYITRQPGGGGPRNTTRYFACLPEGKRFNPRTVSYNGNGSIGSQNGSDPSEKRFNPRTQGSQEKEKGSQDRRPVDNCKTCQKTAPLNKLDDDLVCDECLIKLTPSF